MYLLVGAILVVIIAVRFVAGLLGFRFRPLLPQSGLYRYYADMVIAATILLCFAVAVGFHPSFAMALGIALLASAIAAGLRILRDKKAPGK